MSNVAVTNTFAAGGVAIASQVNTNFTDLVNFINNRNTGVSSWDGLVVDTTTLVVDTSNNRVGIGTATPDGPLEIEGSAVDIHQDSSGNAYHYIDRGTTSSEGLVVFQTAGTNKCAIGLDNDTTDSLYLFTSGDLGTPKVCVLANGRVGVGTTSPSDLFHVSGSDDIAVRAQSSGADSRAFFQLTNDANSWTIDTEGADSDKLRVLDGSSNQILNFSQSAGEVVFNEGGLSTLDVRMESDNKTNMFLLDSSADAVFFGGTAISTGTVQISGGGIVAGAATASNKGDGTINVSADLYKNNTAYTNPDYVLEFWATGKIEKFRDNFGAASYTGTIPLDDLIQYCRYQLDLPRVKTLGADHSGGQGIFSRTDVAMEKIEEAFIYIFQLHERLKTLEA